MIIIVVPMIIMKYGTEFYGIFSLVLLVGSFHSYVNFGFNNALVKFIAEQGKTSESDADIVSTFFFLFIVSVPLLILGLYFDEYIVINILGIPIAYSDSEILLLFDLFYISGFFLFLLQIPAGVLEATQRIYVNNIVQIIYSITNWGLIGLTILFDQKKSYIGLCALLSALLNFALNMIFFVKVWGFPRIPRSPYVLYISFKKLFLYGTKIYVGGLLGFFYEPLTKILLSHFIGVTGVAYYDLILRVKNQFTALCLRIYQPIFSIISGIKDYKSLRLLVHDIEQKSFFIFIPSIPILFVVIPPLLELWIGQKAQIVATSATILLSSNIIFSFTVIPIYQYLIAKNYPEKTIYLQLINILMNAFLLYLLLPILGFNAAVISNSIALAASFMLCFYYQHKYLESHIFDNNKQLLKLLLTLIIISIFSYILNLLFANILIKIIIIPCIMGSLIVLIYRHLRLITIMDIDRYIHNIYINKIFQKLLLKNV
jgi:O-antigen/teichoic acid export membrane protein